MEASVAAVPFAGIGRHLSHSQVSLFDRCQLAWYLKYVRGITKPPTIPMLLGQCYHKALALNFNQKRITAIDLPVEDVVLHFEDCFNASIRSGEVDAPRDANFTFYRDQVSRLLHHYHDEYVLDKMEPVLVEHQMVCEIPGCGMIFAGIVDLQLSDGTMIDFKVSSRRWPASEAAENSQATAYAMLCGYETQFEFHVGLRALKKPAVQLVQATRRQEDVNTYVLRLQQTVALMRDLEEGREEPALCTGFCNEKTCQLWQECRDWRYG